jgi:hypothetical protein
MAGMSWIKERLRDTPLRRRRSIPAWIAFGFWVIWQVLGHASTADWILGILRSISRQGTVAPTKASTTSQWPIMQHSGIISLVLFAVAIAWLTVVALIPDIKPRIYAKFLRLNLVARHPAEEFTVSAMKALRLPLGPTAQDAVVRIFLVNHAFQATTVQRIEAEMELDGVWRKMAPCDLDHYVELTEESAKFRNTNLRNVMAKKVPLDGLLAKLRGSVLRRGIHYEGWVAFGVEEEPEKMEGKKVNLRMFVVDAFEKRHPVLDIGEADTTLVITYSDKAMQQ